MADIRDFKDLIIWQLGMKIAETCYFLTKNYPRDKLFGITQQIKKSIRLYTSKYRRRLWKKSYSFY